MELPELQAASAFGVARQAICAQHAGDRVITGECKLFDAAAHMLRGFAASGRALQVPCAATTANLAAGFRSRGTPKQLGLGIEGLQATVLTAAQAFVLSGASDASRDIQVKQFMRAAAGSENAQLRLINIFHGREGTRRAICELDPIGFNSILN